VNKATTVWGISEQLKVIRIKYPDFNASEFFRMCNDVLISGPDMPGTTELRRRIYDIAVRDYNAKKTEEENVRITALKEVDRKIDARRKEMELKFEEEKRKEEERISSELKLASLMESIFSPNIRIWKSNLPENCGGCYSEDRWWDASHKIFELTGVGTNPN